MTRHSTGAAAIALLALVLAGCDGGGGGETPAESVVEATYPPAVEPETSPEAEASMPSGELESLLLTAAEIPGDGWAGYPAEPDDEEDETGGVCALDFDEVLPAEVDGTESNAAFTNDMRMTFVSESLVRVDDAEARLAEILAQLEGCVGETESTDGESTAVISSAPVDLTIAGAAVSGCRAVRTALAGGSVLQGHGCFGASGDRLLMIVTMTPEGHDGLTSDELTSVLGAATAKAFTG